MTLQIPLPTSDGTAIFKQLHRAWDSLRSVQIDEHFLGGTSLTVDTRYRFEAPDRSAITSTLDRNEIDIGNRSYTRDPKTGKWQIGQNPFPSGTPFPFIWERATEQPRVLADTTIDGKPAYVLALFDPFGIWFRVVVSSRWPITCAQSAT